MKTVEMILRQSWDRVIQQIVVVLPNLLAMLLILATGWIVARLVHWAVDRGAPRLDGRFRQWGLAGCYGRTISRVAFWMVFGCAFLMGINALNTQLGSLLVERAVLYLPRLLTAGVVMLAGILLGRFLARGALIWAVNEGIGPARWIAGGIRVGVGLLAFAGAMEQLGIAPTAVLATFLILLSGTVLALALALGLGSRKRVEHWLESRAAFLSDRKEEEKIEHL